MKGVKRDTGKNEILLFVTTWMDLSGTELNEISQTKTNIVYSLLYVESKTTTTTEQTKTSSKIQITDGVLPETKWGWGGRNG